MVVHIHKDTDTYLHYSGYSDTIDFRYQTLTVENNKLGCELHPMYCT